MHRAMQLAMCMSCAGRTGRTGRTTTSRQHGPAVLIGTNHACCHLNGGARVNVGQRWPVIAKSRVWEAAEQRGLGEGVEWRGEGGGGVGIGGSRMMSRQDSAAHSFSAAPLMSADGVVLVGLPRAALVWRYMGGPTADLGLAWASPPRSAIRNEMTAMTFMGGQLGWDAPDGLQKKVLLQVLRCARYIHIKWKAISHVLHWHEGPRPAPSRPGLLLDRYLLHQSDGAAALQGRVGEECT